MADGAAEAQKMKAPQLNSLCKDPAHKNFDESLAAQEKTLKEEFAAAMDAVNKKNGKTDQKLKALKKSSDALAQQVAGFEGTIGEKQARIDTLEMEAKAADKKFAKFKKDAAAKEEDLNKQLAAARSEKSALEKEHAAVVTEHKQKQRETESRNRDSSEEIKKKHATEIKELQQELASVQKALEAKTTESNEREASLKSLQGIYSYAQDEAGKLLNKINELQIQLQQKNDEIIDCKEKIQKAQGQWHDAENRGEVYKKTLKETESEMHRLMEWRRKALNIYSKEKSCKIAYKKLFDSICISQWAKMKLIHRHLRTIYENAFQLSLKSLDGQQACMHPHTKSVQYKNHKEMRTEAKLKPSESSFTQLLNGIEEQMMHLHGSTDVLQESVAAWQTTVSSFFLRNRALTTERMKKEDMYVKAKQRTVVLKKQLNEVKQELEQANMLIQHHQHIQQRHGISSSVDPQSPLRLTAAQSYEAPRQDEDEEAEDSYGDDDDMQENEENSETIAEQDSLGELEPYLHKHKNMAEADAIEISLPDTKKRAAEARSKAKSDRDTVLKRLTEVKPPKQPVDAWEKPPKPVHKARPPAPHDLEYSRRIAGVPRKQPMADASKTWHTPKKQVTVPHIPIAGPSPPRSRSREALEAAARNGFYIQSPMTSKSRIQSARTKFGTKPTSRYSQSPKRAAHTSRTSKGRNSRKTPKAPASARMQDPVLSARLQAAKLAAAGDRSAVFDFVAEKLGSLNNTART
mmetsp:Transcript_195/g.428  ORF Transcript_195/g.428 Transcript_195/m.428 type:complete len:746 (-) Transcript_195:82-2319(-)